MESGMAKTLADFVVHVVVAGCNFDQSMVDWIKAYVLNDIIQWIILEGFWRVSAMASKRIMIQNELVSANCTTLYM